jgi:signal transduction histidine kinase
MHRDSTFLNRLIERLDRVDAASVQNYLLKLVREKGFLQTVFDSVREGIMVVDRDVCLVYANVAAGNLLGLPGNAVGQPLERFIRDIDWHGIMHADAEEWHRVSLREVEVFYPENRIITFYVVPLPSEKGGDEISLAAVILQDVTENRKATQQALESERVEAITKLAAGVAHELGNPLNSLTIHLQLLAQGIGETQSPEAAEWVDVCLHEVRRLDSIVNNFLRAIRPPPADMQPTEVGRVLADAIRFMRREIEDRGIRVEASLPKRLPRVMGDEALLKQAFYNIMKNAIQAMTDGGLLSIECAVSGYFVEVVFRDSGRGIPQGDMSHIMDPYFTTKDGGTGLGLMVVERICRLHGAELAIESEEKKGTTFTLRFPLKERQTRLLEASRGPEETVETSARGVAD